MSTNSSNAVFDLSQLNVLIAEDNPVNQLILQKFLDTKSIPHEIVSDGSKVVDKVLSKSYDIILMDIQMPFMDGYEASKLIREMDDDYFKNIPIIALSANVFADEVTEAINSGMNDYLTKPFLPEDIYAILTKYFKKVHRNDE